MLARSKKYKMISVLKIITVKVGFEYIVAEILMRNYKPDLNDTAVDQNIFFHNFMLFFHNIKPRKNRTVCIISHNRNWVCLTF